MTPSTPADPLEKLWCGIVDNTTDQSFWIAEILLHGITKETGYCGPGRPSTADLELAERIEKAIVVSLMQQPDDPGPLWAMPLPYFEQARIVAALRNSAPQETRGDEPVAPADELGYFDLGQSFLEEYDRVLKEDCLRGFVCADSPVEILWFLINALDEARLVASQQSPRLEREGIVRQCADVVGNMRQSEAGLFDAMHSGQRGCDRADALYDAYVAILALLSPDTTVVSSTLHREVEK